jgi:short subunit dehydrogenase-like uncharacterized protein
VRDVALEKKLYILETNEPQLVILSVQLNEPELDSLAKRTRLILNCVGPYHLYSSPVVKACARNGTHYVDV